MNNTKFSAYREEQFRQALQAEFYGLVEVMTMENFKEQPYRYRLNPQWSLAELTEHELKAYSEIYQLVRRGEVFIEMLWDKTIPSITTRVYRRVGSNNVRKDIVSVTTSIPCKSNRIYIPLLKNHLHDVLKYHVGRVTKLGLSDVIILGDNDEHPY